jgi:hypothetical protein
MTNAKLLAAQILGTQVRVRGVTRSWQVTSEVADNVLQRDDVRELVGLGKFRPAPGVEVPLVVLLEKANTPEAQAVLQALRTRLSAEMTEMSNIGQMPKIEQLFDLGIAMEIRVQGETYNRKVVFLTSDHPRVAEILKEADNIEETIQGLNSESGFNLRLFGTVIIRFKEVLKHAVMIKLADFEDDPVIENYLTVDSISGLDPIKNIIEAKTKSLVDEESELDGVGIRFDLENVVGYLVEVLE